LETSPAHARLDLAHELLIIQGDAAQGIAAGRTASNDNILQLWQDFCTALLQDEYLQSTADPIPLLRLFTHQYRAGIIAPKGAPVRSRTVEGALRAIGQTLATLGLYEPRLQASGKLDLRLQRQLAAYKKENPPPSRVKPIPLPMLILGFYFLLRPGEYAYTDNTEASPFHLCNVHLLHGIHRLDIYTASDHDLASTTTVALEFTNQKNGVRGELVGLARSGHPRWCPVLAIINRTRHLRLHRTPLTTPLYSYCIQGAWQKINAAILTHHLRHAAAIMGAASGVAATDISVRSLRSSGAMALLCAAVDTDVICLLGRWRSDEMLRYLHVQALPLVVPLATQML
jgi:hypothetical protein